MKSFLVICLIIFLLPNCEEERNKCPQTEFGYEPAYRNPIWHPSDSLVGFNFIPYKKLTYNYDCPDLSEYEYCYDSAGFWIMNTHGRIKKKLFNRILENPSWSYDGRWIAFTLSSQIYIMPFNGAKFDTASIIQLTSEGRNYHPTWSPDGEWIAYDSDFDSETGLKFIWKMKVDGSYRKRIGFIPQLGETRLPFWGSNNTLLHRRYNEQGNCDIYKMDTAGNNLIRLTENAGHVMHLAYNHDCSSVYFVTLSKETKHNELWKIGTTSDPEQLTNQGCDAFTISKNELIIFMNMTDTAVHGNLYVIDPAGNSQPLIK